ncbi:zinc-binding dehydrogenase [Streptomyces sp. NBC_00234]|uniref:quinone oxidoreductase family protein n=1 Tax=Streptomyces sp. NBC_00234 TaxID=2903638 RepID=UPI002E2B4DC8|nr:zinc-binding dehydrogenase [Streptomyces sp. NBC_00234]
MRAVGFRGNGGVEVLEELDLPEPVPAPRQVAVRVAFAGVNFAEIQHRRGEFGAPDGPGGVDIPGLEVAGTVVALGAGVSGLALGEPVAAYLPAFGVLKDAGRLREGEDVLIHSAAGGVGFAAAQLARELGAGRVYGTTGSAEKIPYAAELGYDAVFLREGFAEQLAEVTGGRGVDLVLDPVGGPIREQSLTMLAPFGRLVAYGDLGRHEQWTASVWDLWKGNRAIAGFNIGDLARRAPEQIGEYLAEALRLLAAGRIRAGVTETLPLAEAAKAHQLLETGTGRGKFLLSLG